jgi:hypothetical protein
MPIKRILCIVLTCAVAAALLSPLLQLTVVRSETCQAEAANTMELQWDDGIAMDRVSGGVGGCPECYVFQGVQFTLPEGLSTAVLKQVEVYATGRGTVKVWVTDATANNLITPVFVGVKGTDWYNISLPDVLVGTGFYIWIEIPKGSSLCTTVS